MILLIGKIVFHISKGSSHKVVTIKIIRMKEVSILRWKRKIHFQNIQRIKFRLKKGIRFKIIQNNQKNNKNPAVLPIITIRIHQFKTP